MQRNYGFYTIYSMKELIHYRATIFVESPIGYTKDNVDMFPLKDWKCMPLTNDANTQAINPFEIISKTKDFDGAEWKAMNLEKGFSIVFWGTKIDILGQPFVNEHSFVQMSKQIFEQICASYSIKNVARFSYSPTYGEKNGDFSEIIKHPFYKGAGAENVTARSVYRVDEVINDKNIKINYLIEISSGMFVDQEKQTPSVIYDVDINSTVIDDVIFSTSDMSAFFDKAESFANEFIQQY